MFRVRSMALLFVISDLELSGGYWVFIYIVFGNNSPIKLAFPKRCGPSTSPMRLRTHGAM